MSISTIERPVLPFRETSSKYYVKQEELEYSLLHRYYHPFKVREAILRQRVLERKTPDIYPLKRVADLVEKEKALIVGVIKKSRIPQPQILKELMNKERVIPKPLIPPKADEPISSDEEEEDFYDDDPSLSMAEMAKIFGDKWRKREERRREKRYQRAMNSSWWLQQELPGPSNEKDNDDSRYEDDTLYNNEESDEDPFNVPVEEPIYLELEDESHRIRLSENVAKHSNLTTGCVVGILGILAKSKDEEANYEFTVHSVVYPTTGRPRRWPKTNPRGVIAIISGLELSGIPLQDAPIINSINLFADWLIAKRCTEEEKELASRVERVIIAGNCLGYKEAKEMVLLKTTQYVRPRDCHTPTVAVVKQLDRVISFIAEKNVPVLMIPGHGDPYLHPWPQQPIPECFFPQTELRGTIRYCTNPSSFQLGGIEFLVTSGRNVNDILEQDNKSEPLDIMEGMLKWQHIAPTAPVTIESYPIDFIDPFIMERRPQIYICANQVKADSRWINSRDGRTLLISVPRFSQIRMVTLLDLETMSIDYRYFDWMKHVPKPYCMWLNESYDSQDLLHPKQYNK